MRKIKLMSIDPESVVDSISSFVVSFVLENNKKGYVIGLSGGIDSSVTATIISNAFEEYNKNNDNKLFLKGFILPSNINSNDEYRRAVFLAEKLDFPYEFVSIQSVVDQYDNIIFELKENKYHRGNLISRVRANFLHTFASLEDKLVAGTGNRDEDFGIGYYTLFGDGAVHISPIGNLPKRLVYQVAEYLDVDKSIISAVPTAGLEPGQSDFFDLGYSYFFVELVTSALYQKFTLNDLYEHPQILDVANKDLKKYKEVFGRQKFSSVKSMVDDVYRRHKIALKKARLVSPKIAPIPYTFS